MLNSGYIYGIGLISMLLVLSLTSTSEFVILLISGYILHTIYRDELSIRERTLIQLNATLRDQLENITQTIKREFEDAANVYKRFDLSNDTETPNRHHSFQYTPQELHTVSPDTLEFKESVFSSSTVIMERNDKTYDDMDQTPTKKCGKCGKWCHSSPTDH